jgi:hypothetical protein
MHSRLFAVGFAVVTLGIASFVATAQTQTVRELSVSPGKKPPPAPPELRLDAGFPSVYMSAGDGGQFLWFNRFSPTTFPVTIYGARVYLSSYVGQGDSMEIVVFEDTDGDGDPSDAVVRGHQIYTLDLGASMLFGNYFMLDSPIVCNGPGDVLVGVVNRSAYPGRFDYPAGLETLSSAGRSWFCTYQSGTVPDPPTLPSTQWFATMDGLGYPGNWVIRGLIAPPLTVSGTVLRNDKTPLGGIEIGLSPDGPVVTTDSSGKFTTLAPPGWSGIIYPMDSSYSFKPPSKTVKPLKKALAKVKFTATPN